MFFQGGAHFHERFVRGGHFLGQSGNWMRRAHPRHDVFPLCIDQILAVENFLAAGGIARESHARRARFAHIAENHRLDVDRRAPIVGDAIFSPVNNRTIIHPRTKDCADRAPKLFLRVLWK